MNSRLSIFFMASALFIVGAGSIVAQNYTQTPVTVSSEKVKGADGNVYYSHVVLPRQTLFSIARAYGVSVEDIYNANKDTNLRKEGLKDHSIILIPVKGATNPAGQSSQASQSGSTARVDSATDTAPGVKGSTSSIGGQSVASTSAQVSSGTKEVGGQSATRFAVTNAADEHKKGLVHVTKWYEDLDDIAYRYSVPKEVLMVYNGLESQTLKRRQKLRIPTQAEVESIMSSHAVHTSTSMDHAAKSASATFTSPETMRQASASKPGRIQPTDRGQASWQGQYHSTSKVNALLMLPFNASSDEPNSGNLDFYSGVLLAVKDLESEGIETDLSVYDVSGQSVPMTQERLSSSDLSIGPVDNESLVKILSMDVHSTPVISPLDHKASSLVASFPALVQAPTSSQTQYSDLVSWIEEEYRQGDKVVVITEKHAAQTPGMAEMEAALSDLSVPVSRFAYTILEGRTAVNSLATMFAGHPAVRVVINSESEAFVNDAVRNLDMLVYRDNNVILYAPSKFRSFETIDVENLHNLSARVSTAYYVDYDSQRVKSFLLRYRALYGTEPTPFAYQGYDVAYFFIKSKAIYGSNWIEKVAKSPECQMMQTDFLIRKTEGGGYVNYGIRRIEYGPDFAVRIVEK